MSENLFKFFPKKPQTRIPSHFFGEIDFGLRHTLDLLPKLYVASEPFFPLIASDYDRLVLQKNAERLKEMFVQRQREGEGQAAEQPQKALPHRGNNLCAVCQLRFDDYLIHVNGSEHKEVLERSEAFLSVKELAQDLHEQFVRESLELRLQPVESQPRSARTSRGWGRESTERSSPLSSLYWRSKGRSGREGMVEACCQTSVLEAELPTAKKPLRILCAKSRSAKWAAKLARVDDKDWSDLRIVTERAGKLAELLHQELKALTKMAFRCDNHALEYTRLLPPLDEL